MTYCKGIPRAEFEGHKLEAYIFSGYVLCLKTDEVMTLRVRREDCNAAVLLA